MISSVNTEGTSSTMPDSPNYIGTILSSLKPNSSSLLFVGPKDIFPRYPLIGPGTFVSIMDAERSSFPQVFFLFPWPLVLSPMGIGG